MIPAFRSRLVALMVTAAGGAALAAGAGAVLGAESANALEGVESLADIGQVAAEPLTIPERLIDEPAFALVDAGAEPREILSLAAHEGTEQRLALRQTGSQEFWLRQTSDTYALPDIQLDLTLRVLAHDGDTRFVEVTVDRAESVAAEDEDVVDQYGQLLVDGFGGTSVAATDPQGALLGTEPILFASGPGEMMVIGPVDRNILTLADPLPAEALGSGAVWEYRNATEWAGFPATVVRRYSLVSADGDEIVATVQRSVVFATGDQGEAELLLGSALNGSGVATWHRFGIVGTVAFDLSGVLRYGLPGGEWMEQRLNRSVSVVTSLLTVPAEFAPPPTTVPAAPAADPAPAEPSDTDGSDTDGSESDGSESDSSSTTAGSAAESGEGSDPSDPAPTDGPSSTTVPASTATTPSTTAQPPSSETTASSATSTTSPPATSETTASEPADTSDGEGAGG